MLQQKNTRSSPGDDSERELFCDDILHVLQSTVDSHINSGTDNDIGHTVFTVNWKPSITRRNHHNGKAKLKR